MVVATAVMAGFGVAYLEVQKHHRMSDELAQWELNEWKENLLDERQREFLGRSK